MRLVVRLSLCQGNGVQRAERLEQQAGPFDRGQRRLADDDALAACLHCRLECTDDLVLRRPLPFVGARHGKRGLHRLDQRRWQRRERCALLSHCWPFLMDRVVDMLVHKGANPRRLLGGKVFGQQVDSTKGARLVGNGDLCLFKIAMTVQSISAARR